MPPERPFTRSSPDVAVYGAGPAGCAAAIRLADAGVAVAMVHRPARNAWPKAETVDRRICETIEELGLRDRFAAAASPSYGIRSYWGSAEPVDRPGGWHLDRERFDAGLREAAQDRRVMLTAWPEHAAARIQIDASGRMAGGAMRCDHTIARAQVWRLHTSFPCLHIETAAGGWCSLAPLSEDRLLAMTFTDSDLEIPAFPHAREVLSQAAPEGDPFCLNASMRCRRKVADTDWLAAGDAASTLDPLSGQGIHRALLGGMQAADAALGMLNNKTESAEVYQDRIHRRFAADCERRAAYYRAEPRWPDAPFWRRRQYPAVMPIP